MLSGHNHGGQIRLPFIGPTYLFADHTQRLEAGLFQEGSMPLYINPGLGAIYFPLRFLARRK